MSKKNNQKKKKELYKADLERDKQLQLKKKKADEKFQRLLAVNPKMQIQKKKTKRKGIRVRRGMRIRGIKIVDKESKEAVLQKLKAEQAMKMMVDEKEDEEWEEME
eukprot:TRINITY_DN5647_c0_g1_i1.p3 TRINITY_DN5647_c0_g1~~TRINITY_DN5647_c0_g1_i1.p3  ORF type:complete len:106 (-),score=28.04 TRINITY_DN5647_c0_g1_i1:49-366(-)